MSYNKDTDYSLLIDEAVKDGDYVKAAQYEVTRNEKIDGEKLDYEKTNKYKGWLDSTDYGTVLQNQMKAGASKNAVAKTLGKRVEKASGTDGLIQYAYDDIYDSAIEYLKDEDEGFEYDEKKPVYKDKYSETIKNHIGDLLDTKKFSYSPYDDDLYEYYKEEYARRGERAMEDTLGVLSAQTGGVASSYAVNAASQSYDYYNMKTAEKIPELYKLAYSQYLDGIQRNIEGINLLSDLSDEQYKRYYDSVKAYEADRNFAYNAYKDAANEALRRDELGWKIYESDRDYFRDVYDKNLKYSRDVYESDRDYNLEVQKYSRDAFEDNRDYELEMQKYNRTVYEDNRDYERDTQQDLYDLAMEKWDTLGYLDPQSAEVLGLPAGTKTLDYIFK